ncbi:D-ribose pyranase [Streptomyces coffeae]|uniref:D-ribose pyranase n=1 Tax=Streptomyces coffeae TaxID=621382 RepID=A0ABS1NDA3_9ACTN|nr:D-ribose pyranase [Streptomyces coffeae]MBL1098053.1 D-ribose pyranase [Streptomyces coffeae]
MKRAGVINRHLSAGLALLGHTDTVMVCDAGLPIPSGPDGPVVVDLAFVLGVPSFEQVLTRLLDELVVEGATAAYEVRDHNKVAAALLEGLFPDPALTLVPHQELKALTGRARLVVRTGEARPYANVLLRCGVPF